MVYRIQNVSISILIKNLRSIVLISFIVILLINSLNLNIQAETNNFKGLSTNAPGPTVDSSLGNFRVDTWDTNFVTQAEVEDYAEVLEDAYSILVGSWNFPDPMLDADEPPIEVTVENTVGEYNGWACCPDRESNFKTGVYPDYITQGFPADHEPLKVAGHELFHICQYAHTGTPASKWVREGQARMIQDKLSDWLDHADGTEAGSSFVRQSQGYLSENHKSDLTTISYSSCLFWQYYCEQFGTDTTDPDYGVDAITTYWSSDANPSGGDGVTMLNNALDYISPGTSFEDIFEDFSIAIYTKDFNAASVPSEWTFIDDDEIDGSGNYGTISKEIDPIPTLLPGGSLTDLDENVTSWANKYYEVNIDPGVEVISIQFNQSTTNKLFYALICSNGNDVEYSYTVESKDFRRAIINNNYDKICIIVAGLENVVANPAMYEYEIEAGTPFINIEYPKNLPEPAQARVGPHNAPEKFIAIVNIYYRQDLPVHGFFTENFISRVGGIDADVLTAVDVYGKYFLQIQAPNQTANGFYKLDVDLVDADINVVDTDMEPACVNYGASYYDIMVNIDRSGSMISSNKILAAKSAGKLFVNSFLSEDQLGVIQFESIATLLHGLAKLTPGNRSNAISQIESISAGGSTSIGDSLFKSQNELYLKGISDYPDHIVLLSDGMENTAPMIYEVLPHILGNGTVIHVITIGADAAYEQMQELAADTGGTYFHCFDPSSGDIPNDLAELYRAIFEKVRHMERFYYERGEVNPGTAKQFKLKVTDDMDRIEFVVHYNASQPPTSIQLRDPSNNPVSFTYTNDVSGMGHRIYQKDYPQTGEWTITITTSASSSELLYFVEGAAHTYLTMTLLTPPNGIISPGWGNTEKKGSQIPILISLTDTKEIRNAEVHMTVTPPGYKSHNTLFQIPLYDDGNHGDSLPNDGIYGNLYTATSEEGSYQFLINSTGTDNKGRSFMRIKTGAFYLQGQRQQIIDTDGDGLTDNWEKYYGLNHLSAIGEHGASGDPDQDWLTNINEFFHGTDPLNSDTDYGGQGDNSEVYFGLNPLDPSDDSMQKFPSVQVYPGNKFVYMMMPNASTVNYNNLYIYRSMNPVFGYSIIYGSKYIETYNDTSVTNYQTYYYRFLADTALFNETGFTRAYKAIPKENVLSAEASVKINNGSKTTKTNLVNISISISRNDESSINAFTPTHMRYAEDIKDLISASWISFIPEFQMLLSTGEGVKFVFIQLRDSQIIPEVSPLFSAGIRYTGEIEEVIGLEPGIVFFMISVEFIVISIVFYKRKKEQFKKQNY